MYQALYRKYRPTTLEEIAGQRVITKTIVNEIKNDKLSHAYLFAGPRGTGKTSIAKIIAKIINCDHLDGITPCNKCVNCTQFNLKQSNDIIEIDAASNNGVDEIRELKSKVGLVPSTGKYKIYIIDEVHMLTVGAFNALLKTLEEPPAHIIFILATTDPHKIPNTILSRCQRFDFEKIAEKDIVERLQNIIKEENIKISEDALYEIARLSDGGMRDSISMLDQVISYVDEDQKIEVTDVHEINGTIAQEELTEFIDSLLHKNLENIFLQIDSYNQAGKNIIKLTEEIVMYLRNLLLLKEVPTYFNNKHYPLEAYKNISGEIKTAQIIELIDQLNKALPEMKTASSPKIILELTLIRIMSKNDNVESTQTISKPVGKNILVKDKTSTMVEPMVKEEKQKVNSIPEEAKKVDEETKLVQNPIEVSKENISLSLNSINQQIKTEMNKIKQRRIENTLATFDKKTLLKYRSDDTSIRSKILDPDYNQLASMILDGELKAAGNDYLVYVYSDENCSDLFNENLIKLEKMFEDIYHQSLKLISTYQSDWENIKNEFNKKLRKYEYQEEDFNLEDILNLSEKEDQDDIANLFGSIVEYK